MSEPDEDLLFEGVSVDIAFAAPGPTFGDLLRLCGEQDSADSTSVSNRFVDLADLQFSQVDDYFGVRSLGEDGDDVVVWLYPVIGDAVVHHNAGPYDGLRLEYCILRNPVARAEHFLRCVQKIGGLGLRTTYQGQVLNLDEPTPLRSLRSDIDDVVEYWASEGIVVGSDEALSVDY